jgi:hypothetical protein
MSNQQPQKINNVIKFKDYMEIGRAAEAHIRADFALFEAGDNGASTQELSELKSKSAALHRKLFDLVFDDL